HPGRIERLSDPKARPMKTHAQVAVIGGGVVGASVLYHLARAGWTDIVQGEVSFDGVLVSPLRKSQLLGRPTQLLLRPIPPPGSSERRGRALGYFVERFDLREMESMLAEDATDLAPAPWLLDAEAHILARAGKVVEDAGVRPFPLPAAPAAPSASSGTVVAEQPLPGLGPTVY